VNELEANRQIRGPESQSWTFCRGGIYAPKGKLATIGFYYGDSTRTSLHGDSLSLKSRSCCPTWSTSYTSKWCDSWYDESSPSTKHVAFVKMPLFVHVREF